MSRTFAAVSILSLALGIGATVTVFSVIYGALIAPYPYAGADRMIQVRLYGQGGQRNYLLLSARQFELFRKLDILDGAVAMDNWDMASTGDALPEAVHTAHLSGDAFAYFGVPPLAGRTFSARDPERVLVLGYPYWQQRYGGNLDAIGKTLQLDHQNYTILGVMPPRFRWGNGDVYKPLAVTSDADRIYIVDARVRAGVTPRRAEAAMQPLLEQFAKETPGHFPPDFHVHVAGLTGIAGGSLRTALLLLFGAVGVLLAVGCANVSILLLARGTARQHEFAVRAALGASRGRLIRQMFRESLVLAIAGGAVGVLLAFGGLKAVTTWLPAGTFPPETVIHLNLQVPAFSTAAAVVTGMVFGIAPALHFSSPQLHDVMRTAVRTTTGPGKRGMRDLLVAVPVALTILMLVTAGGATRAFVRLYHTKLGYDPRYVLTAGIALPDGSYTTYETRAAFYRAIHQHVASAAGVESAAISLFSVPPNEGVRQNVEIGGTPSEPGQSVDVQETTGEYFATLRIPMLAGRTWSEAENDRAAHVAVINQEMARRFWPWRQPDCAADPAAGVPCLHGVDCSGERQQRVAGGDRSGGRRSQSRTAGSGGPGRVCPVHAGDGRFAVPGDAHRWRSPGNGTRGSRTDSRGGRRSAVGEDENGGGFAARRGLGAGGVRFVTFSGAGWDDAGAGGDGLVQRGGVCDGPAVTRVRDPAGARRRERTRGGSGARRGGKDGECGSDGGSDSQRGGQSAAGTVGAGECSGRGDVGRHCDAAV